MNFKLEELQLDLGTTTFENMFLNMYVEKADGQALKFYLLVYKDIYNQGYVDKSLIKKKLSLTDDQYEEYITYWIGMGAFREKMDLKGNTYVEIVSFRQMVYGDKTKTSPNEENFELSSRKAIMFENVESIINRALTPTDLTRIHDVLDEYGQDPELVTEAFRQAKEGGNVDVKYVMGYLKTWRDQSIISLNDLKIYEERKKLKRKNSPRQYKRSSQSLDESNSYMSFAEKSRRARIEQMLNEDKNE